MKKQNLKTIQMAHMMKKSLMDLPCPSSISTLWNMGFLLGGTLSLQIITGLIVSMMYVPDVTLAFPSIIAMMQDINLGWITRLIHMNGASLMFILIYTHTARGIYFSSPSQQNKVWASGVAIMLATMATAFLGYVLPWGQMSFWGATVITGVISAIPILGNDIITWIWGGPSISQPTLNRFFSLHFLLPMIIAILMMIHLILLHEKGSSNPTSTSSNPDKIKFHPLFSIKDFLPILVISSLFMSLCFTFPNVLGDVENFNTANPLIAPVHIQPEWYFLFAYVILRSIPSKLGGVIALVMSILIILVLVTKKTKSMKFSPTKKTKFWIMVSILAILTWIGAKTVEPPFESIGQFYTFLYFYSILFI